MLSKELLERFKRGEVVFHTPTQEIFNKAVAVAKEIGCNELPLDYWEDFEEYTCVSNRSVTRMSYSDVKWYKKHCPQLDIITLQLSDFDNESKDTTQVIPLDVQDKLMRITYSIAYCRKLEETYGVCLGFADLYGKREKILKELEDSLEIHI